MSRRNFLNFRQQVKGKLGRELKKHQVFSPPLQDPTQEKFQGIARRVIWSKLSTLFKEYGGKIDNLEIEIPRGKAFYERCRVFYDGQLHTNNKATHKAFTSEVDWLVNNGYLEQTTKPYHVHSHKLRKIRKEAGQNYGRTSAYTPTKKTIKILYEIFENKSIRDKDIKELIRIIDVKGRLLSPDTENYEELRDRVNKINIYLSKQTFSYGECPASSISQQEEEINTTIRRVLPLPFSRIAYHRVFANGKCTLHGRFYNSLITDGKNFRRLLLINNEETIETDINSTFPRLLYAEEGIPLTFNGDMYKVWQFTREEGKEAMKRMLNCKSRKQAIHALKRMAARNKNFARAEDLIKKLEVKHQKIKHLFYRGRGNFDNLAYLESQWTEAVALRFVEEDIPFIAIHDGFRYIKSRQIDAERIMREEWECRYGPGGNILLKTE